MPVSFGFGKKIAWKFIVADIPIPILGMDFLTHNGLIIDTAKRTIVDPKSGVSVTCENQLGPPHGIRLINPEHEFADIIRRYQQLPTSGTPSPGFRNTHHIETRGPPVFARPRRLCPEKATEVKRQISELLHDGVIRPSSSNWASPIHLVKKTDGSWRMCGDYRALNTITIPDRYPVPYLQDFTYILSGCTIFSKVDLLRAFHQVPVEECDIAKTAISTPYGAYEYLRMPFGLRNAAQTQQRLMDEVLRGLPFIFVYLDDILVASQNAKEHRSHLRQVFDRIQKYGLVVNLKKSEFGLDNIDFLGHHITKDGIAPSRAKVLAITEYPAPATVSEMRRYLGMLNFYRRFIPHSAAQQSRLQSLIITNKKNDKTPIIWTPETTRAFQDTKDSISNTALLAHPSPNAELSLTTDASDYAIGGALHQTLPDGQVQPLGFFSRRLTPTQVKYSTFDRELEAVAQAIKHFDYWLEGRQFCVYTDHDPLSKAMVKRSQRSCNRQSERFRYISTYTSDIRYLPGSQNAVADALSRIYSINTSPLIDHKWIAELQTSDRTLQDFISGTQPTSLLLSLTKDVNNNELWCDTSHGRCRPYVPAAAQHSVMTKLHGHAHPGARATAQLISSKYVWSNMDKMCRSYARSCLTCQQNKVHRHNQTALGNFKTPDARFQHVHMDIVGPLPTVDGQSYVLTIVDRYTRWPEAIPMPNITAETTAKHFIKTWIGRFGTPTRITTDQGRQFTSLLFQELNHRLGVDHLQTSPYHPQANGLVERFHRSLKTSIRCHQNENWVDALPTILLALRTQPKEDLGASPAQLVYGTSLRIPGEFLQEATETSQHALVENLSKAMSSLRPTMTSNHNTKRTAYVDKHLKTAKFVFIRVDAVRTPLQSPYTGPHFVVSRGPKTFRLNINGHIKTISVDRLKAAYVDAGPQSAAADSPQTIQPQPRTTSSDDPAHNDSLSSSTGQPPKTTRSGRRIVPPPRLRGGVM